MQQKEESLHLSECGRAGERSVQKPRPHIAVWVMARSWDSIPLMGCRRTTQGLLLQIKVEMGRRVTVHFC